ncbi:hypothetical protein SAMN04490182_5672 [Pseudomonas cedrina]|uniref:Lipoprotein n=2 Tax=Pseudomonas cedrina TaxID=651740 RepID=A0A1V2K907_PSECE|nr:hypothetical protein [Pseudomonas cedrina]ONH54217.1 hypothetical protein BLL36_11085 [Pseudomonas cedrina subsp. cedrina]SDT59709.1 hypothetical protein SAMN04490182_5672 [Pseudomonas cedrina]
MRVFAAFLAVCLLAGCASKPQYYISPAPVTIPKTATYWVDTFDVEVGGKSKHFMADDNVRKALGVDLVERLLKAKRYATSKETADYLLDVDIVYVRHIVDTQGGLSNLLIDDGTILQSIDFGYKVKVKKAGSEVLHFAQNRPGLVPNNWRGQAQQWRTLGGVITNTGNASVERYFTGGLSHYIIDDLQDIPSR